jgi:hypothetical protein
LTAWQIGHLPTPLPITAGRLHYYSEGQAKWHHRGSHNETWKVSKRLAGKYVWVTITTHCRRLEIWYQWPAKHEWRLLKTRASDIPETVARLKPEVAHSKMAR